MFRILNEKPNDGFRKRVIALAIEIDALMGTNPEDLTDEQYTERWYEIEEKFHWMLIRLEQYLGGITQTEEVNELYKRVIKAIVIGKKKTSYYWNVVSKEIFEEIRETGLLELKCDKNCLECPHSEIKDLRWTKQGTTYNPNGWVYCNKYQIWEETVGYLLGDLI